MVERLGREMGSTESGLTHILNAPFHRLMNVQLREWSPGSVTVVMPLLDEFKGRDGVIHGGMVAALADGALGMAVATLTDAPVTTLDLNVTYLRPIPSGDVICEAQVVRHGRRVSYGEASVLTDDGKLAARATCNYIVR